MSIWLSTEISESESTFGLSLLSNHIQKCSVELILSSSLFVSFVTGLGLDHFLPLIILVHLTPFLFLPSKWLLILDMCEILAVQCGRTIVAMVIDVYQNMVYKKSLSFSTENLLSPSHI